MISSLNNMQRLDFNALDRQLYDKNIVIVTHASPDGDAIGSSLAIYHYLNNFNNRVSIIVPDAYSKTLSWLTHADKILNFANSINTQECITKIQQADFIFCLDFNDFKRLGKSLADIITNCRHDKKLVVIDHHLMTPDNLIQENFDYCFINETACSTAILVYEFINLMNKISVLNQELAECIYVGIITDTNNLTTANITADVYRVIAELLEYGVNPSKAYNNIYEYNFDKLQLLGDCLKNKINYLPELNIAVLIIRRADFVKYNIQSGDTDGIINYALLLKDVNLAISLIERNNLIKMSFRSKNGFSASAFAREHFYGGGHFNAAGGISKLNIDETFKKIINVVKSYGIKTKN